MGTRGLAKAAARKRLGTAASFGGFGGFRGMAGYDIDRTVELPMSPFKAITPAGRRPPADRPFHPDEGGLGATDPTDIGAAGGGPAGGVLGGALDDMSAVGGGGGWAEGSLLDTNHGHGHGDDPPPRSRGRAGGTTGGSTRASSPATPTSASGAGAKRLKTSEFFKRAHTPTTAGEKHRAKNAYLLDVAMGSEDDDDDEDNAALGPSLTVSACDTADVPRLDKQDLVPIHDVPYMLPASFFADSLGAINDPELFRAALECYVGLSSALLKRADMVASAIREVRTSPFYLEFEPFYISPEPCLVVSEPFYAPPRAPLQALLRPHFAPICVPTSTPLCTSCRYPSGGADSSRAGVHDGRCATARRRRARPGGRLVHA